MPCGATRTPPSKPAGSSSRRSCRCTSTCCARRRAWRAARRSRCSRRSWRSSGSSSGRPDGAARQCAPADLPPCPPSRRGKGERTAPQSRGVRGEAPPGPQCSTQHLALFVVLAAAYVGTTLLATVLSPLPAIAFWGSYLRGEGAVAVASYAVLFLVVADRLRHRAQLDRLVSVLLATSLPVCLYAVPQAMGHDPFGLQNTGGRAAATAGNA